MINVEYKKLNNYNNVKIFMENNPDIKPKGKNKTLTYIVIVIVLVAIIGGGLAYHFITQPSKPPTQTITIAAPVYGSSSTVWTNFINNATKSWQASHPNVTIKFVGPSGASSEGQYYTKLDLMTASSSTAPTIMLEDMFYTATYQSEGILAPLNKLVNSTTFSNVFPSALGQMTINGTHYGLPTQVTDTLIYYNITLLQNAGVIGPHNTTWQPTNWTQIINAAKLVKTKFGSSVIPLNVYEGVKADEASSFTSFETLLYGTGYGLYNFSNSKWYGNNPGLNETLTFYHQVFSEGLAQSSLSSTPYVTVGQYMQQGKLAIAIDGSWMYGYQWAPGAQHPINNFSKYVGVAYTPTFNGAAPHYNSMVGGWGWSMYNGTKDKALAASFMLALDNTTNQITLNLPGGALAGGLPTSKNAVNNSDFKNLMPTDPALDTFYTNALKYGSYRPPVAAYPKVSALLQTAMGNVVSGGYTVSHALSTYQSSLNSTVGSGSVQSIPSVSNSYTPFNGINAKYTNSNDSSNYAIFMYLNEPTLETYFNIFW